MKPLEEILEDVAAFHGEDCPGQTLGTRLALAGMRAIGLEDPQAPENRKKGMVFIECDRCVSDAIMAVTGLRVGKRTLKLYDYGIVAATFLNLETGKAVRVIAREEARTLADNYAPKEIENKYERQRLAYRVMPDAELFELEPVEVAVPEADLPGRPSRRVQCERCGNWVQDYRDVEVEGETLCIPCAEGAYFSRLEEQPGI